MKSPTGRIIPHDNWAQQELNSIPIMERMREIALANGAVEVAPDMFEVDFAEIERRVMAAMGEEVPYIVTVSRYRGGVSHKGPFPTQKKAEEYARRFDNEESVSIRVSPLDAPEDK